MILGAVAAWIVADLCVVVRNRGGEDGNVGLSEIALAGFWVPGICAGFFVVHLEVGVFGDGWTTVALGMLVLALGLGLRFWAIFTLGRFFMHTVAIQPDHQIIRSGPYRLLRHPSYTGATLAFVGLGISLQNWLSLLILAVIPLIGTLIRIEVEEKALADAFGSDYLAYTDETHRLIPGLW